MTWCFFLNLQFWFICLTYLFDDAPMQYNRRLFVCHCDFLCFKYKFKWYFSGFYCFKLGNNIHLPATVETLSPKGTFWKTNFSVVTNKCQADTFSCILDQLNWMFSGLTCLLSNRILWAKSTNIWTGNKQKLRLFKAGWRFSLSLEKWLLSDPMWHYPTIPIL